MWCGGVPAQDAVTKYHGLGGINTVILSQFRSWKSEIRVPVALGSGEGSLSGLQTATCSPSPHRAFAQYPCGDRDSLVPLPVRPPTLSD